MPSHYAITMPQLSDTMTEGVVVTWEKKPGERVARGDIVATVETDKAIMDVEVFNDGYLAGPLAEAGTTVPVGGALGYISDTPGELAIPQDEVVTRQVAADIIPHDAGIPILMPQLSDTMTEGTVVTWEKAPGERVNRGDVVATVETDKAIMDVEVFQEGYLSGPVAGVDSVILVGHPLGFIVDHPDRVKASEVIVSADHKVVAPQPQAAPSPVPAAAAAAAAAAAPDLSHIPHSRAKPAPRPANRYASPYARRLAAQAGADLNRISASGPNGVIVSADVAHALPSMAEVAHQLPQVQVPGQGRAMTSMEKAVAHSMAAALTMPTFQVTLLIRPETLIAAAKARNVSVTVAIAKACSVAMRKHPWMNSAYQPIDRIVERDNHDFGVAVAADGGGLVVPILHNVESQSLEALQAQWSDLMPRARVRKLAPAEYANPTFTISNMGMYGVAHFTAIPTPGISAIMAIAANGPEGMPVTITADHRVVNGAHVAAYLAELKQVVENPEGWLGAQAPAQNATPIPAGSWDTDVVVIGGGPGGEDCARHLADHGTKVTLINNAPLPGGECLWRGCIPSKTWRAAADRLRDRAHDAALGVKGTDKGKLVWETLEGHRAHILNTRGEMALKTDRGVKIDMRTGFASFVDAHTLKVVPPEGEPYALTFGAAVIATGAPPFVPPIPGARDGLSAGGIITSDTVWNLARPPKRLGIIGAGAIGVEMAQIFHDFGAEVLLLEAKERPLAEVEEEIAHTLTTLLGNEPRLSIVTAAKISEIGGTPGAMTLAYADRAGKSDTYTCDYVLMATGKRPDTAGLNLGALGLAMDGAAIKVDAGCRTSVPHVYAVGDVIGGYMLAHTAGAQGRVAAENLLGEPASYDQAVDCGVIFSRPQAGFVGLSLAQAKAMGIDAVEAKIPLSIDAKAMITLETDGMIKMVADKATQRVIGIHLLADHTDTLIGEAVMIVSGKMTLSQVANAIHPHPTQTELFGELARRLSARLRRTAAAKK